LSIKVGNRELRSIQATCK